LLCESDSLSLALPNQVSFKLSHGSDDAQKEVDPGVEEALYESPVLQRFVGVDLGAAPSPDETTICFRHLLEKHDLCGMMLESVNMKSRWAAAPSARIRPHAKLCSHKSWRTFP